MEICLGLEVLEGLLTIALWLCFRVTDIQSFISSTVLSHNKFPFIFCIFAFLVFLSLLSLDIV